MEAGITLSIDGIDFCWSKNGIVTFGEDTSSPGRMILPYQVPAQSRYYAQQCIITTLGRNSRSQMTPNSGDTVRIALNVT